MPGGLARPGGFGAMAADTDVVRQLGAAGHSQRDEAGAKQDARQRGEGHDAAIVAVVASLHNGA